MGSRRRHGFPMLMPAKALLNSEPRNDLCRVHDAHTMMMPVVITGIACNSIVGVILIAIAN